MASLWLTAVTVAGCVSTGQMASPEKLKAIHNVVVVSLLGDDIGFEAKPVLGGILGGRADSQEINVDLGLNKMAADDIVHDLSGHVTAIAADVRQSASSNASEPPAPTLDSLRALGIAPSAGVDTYVIIRPTTLGGAGPGLLAPTIFSFTGLVVMSSGTLFAIYTVTLMDAHTGEIFANGNPEITKQALGKMMPVINCDASVRPETPTAMTDAERQTLTQEFSLLLKASLPWALANAGLLSDAEATADDAAVSDFGLCKRVLARGRRVTPLGSG